jgi:flagellar biosynthesis protein FlhG
MARVFTVTSGTDGVGKTSICVNLAAQLAQRGQRVCLLDADGGGTNVSMSLGLKPRHTLKDLILYGRALDDVLIRNCQGFDVVPASSSADWKTALTSEQLHHLAASLAQLDDYDFLLIDCSTSTARNVLSFAQTSAEVILVITPAPISPPDAYSLLNLLHSEYADKRIQVVVNKSINHAIGRHSYGSFREVANFYLGIQLPLLGVVSEDKHMQAVLHEQQPPVNGDPQAAAARNIGSLADQLLVENAVLPERDMQSFCNRYLKAVETKNTSQMAAAEDMLEIPDCRKHKLRQHLEYLSHQVDKLIGQLERLRADGMHPATLLEIPASEPYSEPEPCTETSVAELANESEAVTVQGEMFSIYRINRSDGGRQHFAWHSLDDNPVKP